jgi:cell shape-determining protein MreD
MKQWVSIVAWGVASALAILFQPKITIFDFPLNLTVVLVYAFAIKAPPLQSASTSFTDVSAEIRGAVFGAGIGLIEDIMSGSVIGLNVMSKGLTGLISSIVFRDLFYQWTPLIGSIVLFVITLLDGIIFVLAGQFIAGLPHRSFDVVDLVLIQALFNIPFGLLIRPGQKVASMRYV